MIKINLALRKQSTTASSDGRSSGLLGSGVSRMDLRLDGLRDLPIRKIAIGLVVCLGLSYGFDLYKQGELEKLDAAIRQGQAESARLQVEVAKLKNFDVLKKQLDADEFVLKTKIETIEKLIADRQTPHRILVALSTTIPADVWLSAFTIQDGVVTLSGSSLGFNQISDFMKSLNENIYFTELSLKKTEQAKDAAGRELAQFELTAKRRQQ